MAELVDAHDSHNNWHSCPNNKNGSSNEGARKQEN